MRRPRLVGAGRRRGVPAIALVGAAALGFAGAYGVLSPDRPAPERRALVDRGGMERSAVTGGETSGGDCNIKGNISVSTGERIYHLPGQEYYDETRISPGKGERFFCSEAEARAAGWRRSKV